MFYSSLSRQKQAQILRTLILVAFFLLILTFVITTGQSLIFKWDYDFKYLNNEYLNNDIEILEFYEQTSVFRRDLVFVKITSFMPAYFLLVWGLFKISYDEYESKWLSLCMALGCLSMCVSSVYFGIKCLFQCETAIMCLRWGRGNPFFEINAFGCYCAGLFISSLLVVAISMGMYALRFHYASVAAGFDRRNKKST